MLGVLQDKEAPWVNLWDLGTRFIHSCKIVLLLAIEFYAKAFSHSVCSHVANIIGP
jgi:hypothetical protein